MAEGEGKERDGEKEGLTGTLQSEAERTKESAAFLALCVTSSQSSKNMPSLVWLPFLLTKETIPLI